MKWLISKIMFEQLRRHLKQASRLKSYFTLELSLLLKQSFWICLYLYSKHNTAKKKKKKACHGKVFFDAQQQQCFYDCTAADKRESVCERERPINYSFMCICPSTLYLKYFLLDDTCALWLSFNSQSLIPIKGSQLKVMLL